MKNLEIVKSTAEDIFELKDNLRAEDVEECRAGGHTPQEALLNGYVWSDECYSAKVNGKTEAMFGVCSQNQPEGVGVIWYLGSDETMKHPIAMVRDSQKYIDGWFNKYKMLWNVVDARNTTHINWLKHLGFIFTTPVVLNGYKFIQFYKNKEEK